MKPVPSSVLSILILALCGLCAWQWHRESQLRQISRSLGAELNGAIEQRNQLEARAKAADAEILRLTGALAELREHSVTPQAHTDLIAANTKLSDDLAKQNAIIKEQAATLVQANASILKSNETVRGLSAERDRLVLKVNEVTALYNALAAKRE